MSNRLIQITVSRATLVLLQEALEDSLLFCDNHPKEKFDAMLTLKQQIRETIVASELEDKMEELLSDVEEKCKDCPSKSVCFPTSPDPTKVILN